MWLDDWVAEISNICSYYIEVMEETLFSRYCQLWSVGLLNTQSFGKMEQTLGEKQEIKVPGNVGGNLG